MWENMKIGITLNTFLVVGLSFLVLYGSSCSKKDVAGEKSMKAQAILDDLNEWHTEELDILENPDKYPNRILSGETNGWVYAHKRELEELGYSIRWNNDKKLYKLEPIEEKEN